MTVALAVVAALELGLIGWGIAQRRGIARYQKRRVVVHTLRPDDQSIRGVLTGVYPDCLVLSSPDWIDEAQQVGVDGDAVILRANVSWVEVL